jgi:hypothetical protein
LGLSAIPPPPGLVFEFEDTVTRGMALRLRSTF